MTDYDSHDVMSAEELTEEDQRAEYALDASDEARWAAEQAALETRAATEVDECAGKLINGSWVHCPCVDCQDHADALDDDEESW